jgi:hypothetical protein
MKTLVTQRYEVTLRDGTKHVVCCAPRIVTFPEVHSYRPIGESRVDVCCHKGRTADLCREQNAKMRERIRR